MTRSSSPGDSARISPTAHYTGYVWARHGLGAREFATPQGRLAWYGLRPLMAASRAFGGPTLEGLLLARHRVIDHLLTEEITSGRVGQVLELAAGMSPRGRSFATRFGDRITYVEADLPGMAERKRRTLDRMGPSAGRHVVEAVDVLAESGPLSLAELSGRLDPGLGLAVITEGLLAYLEPADLTTLWTRIAGLAGRFPHGVYLSDLHLGQENGGPVASATKNVLAAVVRGRLHFPYSDATDAEGALRTAGFGTATLHRPADFGDGVPGVRAPGADRVRIIEARTREP
ncbi:class I SAM-dependent methyltransferase [Streptomyces specialis]|uniref:class I SAM-dependent methyltransferase n=1 Tax=Streptomyces specialis TaxID=498367 RepID=UPI00099E6C25|nr:class I SAM-dependent methyltransferase [Streptomyces specialis]